MIFEIKQNENVYTVDDLKPFSQQAKAFQKAFNEANKTEVEKCLIAAFDNASVSVFFESRVIVTLNEADHDENI